MSSTDEYPNSDVERQIASVDLWTLGSPLQGTLSARARHDARQGRPSMSLTDEYPDSDVERQIASVDLRTLGSPLQGTLSSTAYTDQLVFLSQSLLMSQLTMSLLVEKLVF